VITQQFPRLQAYKVADPMIEAHFSIALCIGTIGEEMSYNRDRYSSTMFMPQRAPVRYMLTCVTIAAVLVVVRALIADAGAIGGPRVTANSSHAIEAMASTPATMTVATLYAGLTHYWKLDEVNSPYADSVGAASATCLTCPSGAAGLIGSALNFDGTDDALSMGAIAAVNWAVNQSFSIEFWMQKSTSCVGAEAIIGRTDSQTRLKWWVGCSGSGEAVFELFDRSGFGQSLSATTRIVDGGWHHIAAVRDAEAGENRIYVDGTLETSTAVNYADGFISQTAALNIGWLDNSAVNYHFSGVADEVAIHNGVLSDADISQHYGDGSVGLRRGYLGCTRPVRIMPLGDSITRRNGYRAPLWFNLTDHSYDVDFVGGVADRCSSNFNQCAHDPDHEGHSGFSPAQIATNLNRYLTAYPLDVILLHIGTNDLDIMGVEDILDIINGFGPEITVVLAQIINRMTFHQPTTDFNDAIAVMVQQRLDRGGKLIMVDMESALTYPDDMIDELHPNQDGFNKMAVVWYNSLTSFLPVCP
jgi:Concanavalin A-like lectin/glucanases superfamily